MQGLIRFLKNNGLSLAFGALFLLCLAGTAVSGHALQREHPSGPPAASLAAYLASADFLRGIMSNWQAALLQLWVLVVFAVFLRQRGSSHSRKPADDGKPDRQDRGGVLSQSGSLVKRNSLSLALLAGFVLSFAVFAVAEFQVYNQERTHAHEAVLGVGAFLGSARLWFDVLQTWEAEFFAMGAFLVMTIFLRQDDSAESKPVWADDDETGDVNE
jgi:hypothetical protein